MADQATVSPRAKGSAARLGGFVLGERIPEIGERVIGAVFATAVGAPDGPHAGVPAVAMCSSLPEGNPAAAEQAGVLLARVQALAGPRSVPIIEAGVAGRVGYVIEARQAGERLSARLAREHKIAPWQAAVFISDVAASLANAHAQRVSHGALVPQVVWIDGQGRAHLGGYGLLGRGPMRDQWMLAALSYELLAGHPWSPDYAGDATGMVLVERLRGRTNGLTEQIGRVVSRGLEGEATSQFPDIQSFANAFAESVRDSAVELAAGAWEAIARGDLTMAAILVEMAANYNPAQPELTVLRVRLNGGAMRDANYATQALAGPAAAITMNAPDIAAVANGQIPITPRVGVGTLGDPSAGNVSLENVHGGFVPGPAVPADVAVGGLGLGYASATAGLAGQQLPANLAVAAGGGLQGVMGVPSGAFAPSKPARNPWLIFAIGACACVIVLTILVAVTFSTV